MRTKQKSAFADRKMIGRAIKDSFAKFKSENTGKKPGHVSGFCVCDLDQYPLGGIPVRVKRRSKRIYTGDCHYPLVYPCYLPTLPRPCRRSW